MIKNYKMKLNKFLALILFLILPQVAQTESNDGIFLKRIHEVKEIVKDLEPRSAGDILKDLRETSSPEGNLQIFEAVAATYKDLVVHKNIVDKKDKRDLYDQIRLNVAFIQFGGNPNSGDGKKLDRWIRQTLIKYLPQDLMNDEDMFFSIDELNKGG